MVAHSCQGWVPTKAKAMAICYGQLSCGAVKPVQGQQAHEEEENISTNSFIPKITVLSSPVGTSCGCEALPIKISLPSFLHMPLQDPLRADCSLQVAITGHVFNLDLE